MKRKVKRHVPPESNDSRYGYLPLTQGLNALVPAELFDWLNQWNWHAHRYRAKFYATRQRQKSDGSGPITILLHNVIWDKLNGPIPAGLTVDHANRDGLDNRPDNLRLATQQAQACNHGQRTDNTSGFTGVFCHGRKWQSFGIDYHGRRKHLGTYADKFSAAWVRDEFIKQTRGEFAVTNKLIDRRVKQLPFAIERRAMPHLYVAA